MSGYELSLFLGGFAAGAIVALIVRAKVRTREAEGSVSITNAICEAPDNLRVSGTLSPVDDNICMSLNAFVYPDPTTTPDDTPPPGAATYPPPPAGTPFNILHPLGGVTSGQIVVWGGFGTYSYRSFLFGPCGSGSGQSFTLGTALSEPAARSYRAVIGDMGQEAIDPRATPEVRRALGRREVTLAFDSLGAAPGEALWSEEDVLPSEPVHWRLTLRKIDGKHIATLELVDGRGAAMVWRCLQWHFFAVSRFVADPAPTAGRLLPNLEVQPA